MMSNYFERHKNSSPQSFPSMGSWCLLPYPWSTFAEKSVFLQGNNQVTNKELPRKCIISNKRITLLLFDCYSFIIRLNIEEQSNKKCEKIE